MSRSGQPALYLVAHFLYPSTRLHSIRVRIAIAYTQACAAAALQFLSLQRAHLLKPVCPDRRARWAAAPEHAWQRQQPSLHSRCCWQQVNLRRLPLTPLCPSPVPSN